MVSNPSSKNNTIITNGISNYSENQIIESPISPIIISSDPLTNLWMNICDNPIQFDKLSVTNTINELKKVIRSSNDMNPQSSNAIIGLFTLLDSLAKVKGEGGPLLYKILVFLFFENYNNVDKREFFLSQFSNFYIKNQTVPISILLEPYIKQINIVKNISIADFTFIAYIINHPRFTVDNAKKIVEFSLNITIENLLFARSANMILNLIFSTQILNKKTEIISLMEDKFFEYIRGILNLYVINLKKNIIDNAILETPYDIMLENYGKLNTKLHDIIIKVNEEHKKIKGNFSNALLALLWFYPDHDDVLLRIEEKYSDEGPKENYVFLKEKENGNKKNNISLKNKKIDSSNKENDEHLRRSVELVLQRIKEEKEKKAQQKKEQEMKQKLKEKKIQMALKKELAKKSLALGVGPSHFTSICEKSNLSNLTSLTNQLIQEEGSIIKDKKQNITIATIIRPQSKMKLNTLINFNQFNFINLSDEEPREQRAIEGFNTKYKQKINQLCKALSNEKKTITKAAIIKYLRSKNITNEEFSLDELSLCIRNCFGLNLNEINHSQFKTLIIYLAYIIISKIKLNYTLSECYYNFLNKVIPNLNNQNEYFAKYKPIISFIKKNIENSTIDNINIPPGIKIVDKTEVIYKPKVPTLMKRNFTENYIICIDIINSLLNKITGGGFLENFVKMKKIKDIEIDIGNLRKWSNAIMIAYALLPKEYEKIGIEVADCLEFELRQLCKGRDKMGNVVIPPVKKEKIETSKKEIELKSKKEELRLKRQNEIKEKVENYKKEKEEKRKKELLEKEEKELEQKKQFHEMVIEAKKKNKKIIEELNEIKKKKEEEKNQQLNEQKEKELQLELKQKKEKTKFFQKQNQKLKEQFQIIKTQKENLIKKKMNSNKKLPIIPKDYLEKDKDYIEFDKKLIPTLVKLLNDNQEISFIFSKFEEHLKLIFEIYSKIGQKKLTFNNVGNSVLYINEFKEFLVNFAALNILIFPDQMNYAFKRLSRKNDNKGDNLFITFEDFKTILIFMCIYSKFSDKSTKISQDDVDNLTSDNVKNFFEYLGLKVPFERREIENYINERRGMNAKEFFELQQKIKKEKIFLFKPFIQKNRSKSRPHSKIKIRINSIQNTKENKSSDALAIQDKKSDNNNLSLEYSSNEDEELPNNSKAIEVHQPKIIDEHNHMGETKILEKKETKNPFPKEILLKEKNRKSKSRSKSKRSSSGKSKKSDNSNSSKKKLNLSNSKEINKSNKQINLYNSNGQKETWNLEE